MMVDAQTRCVGVETKKFLFLTDTCNQHYTEACRFKTVFKENSQDKKI